ncbi:ATP-binding cassette domain-containing protein [Rubneribacter sp.]|nr:ATP-binding cassette domain-containing protein [Candidatus Rubneribacter avistercoris]
MSDERRFGDDEQPCLSVRHLTKRFGAGCAHCLDPAAQLERNVCPRCKTVHAVRDASLDVFPGEIVGIVGESGSGKSTLMKCLYFDEEATGGDVRALPCGNGAANLLTLSPQHRRAVRNTVFGMVYQNPYLGLRMDFSSLSNIAEQMIAAGGRNVGAMRGRGEELLSRVNIPLSRASCAPRLFSGGMQQRVQIAKALSNNPPILLLDEVTTGLDLSVQASVLDLIQQIRRDSNVSMLVVSHDLGVIRMLADRTLVMLDGRVIESGLTDQILEDPQHPYTQQLVYSLL